MSNIYIKEPTTNGKILLRTSVGDIDIELWSREAPIACKNFVQLCMEGYYDNHIFHRVVPGFIVQGGDPTGTGEGGESIYGHPFKDEFHSRLRFVRRGLVAMANAGADDNGSQFFFTLGPCNDLNKKHTIFGKVSGDTIYNMIRLGEVETDGQERPINPPYIKSSKVLANPFDDIVPRVTKSKKSKEEKLQKKSKMKATKDFKLLSFGMEAELDEEETNDFKPKHKSKSSHDLANDPKLISTTVDLNSQVDEKEENTNEDGEKISGDVDVEKNVPVQTAQDFGYVKDKLKGRELSKKSETKQLSLLEEDEEEKIKRKNKIEEMQKEAKKIAKELKISKKESEKKKNSQNDLSSNSDSDEEKVKETDNQMYDEFRAQQKIYRKKTSGNNEKGKSREKKTMELLQMFQSKLFDVKNKSMKPEEPQKESHSAKGEDSDDDGWLAHEFVAEEEMLRDAKDMNREVTEERYSLDDPRNPLNKRRRESDKKLSKKRQKHR